MVVELNINIEDSTTSIIVELDWPTRCPLARIGESIDLGIVGGFTMKVTNIVHSFSDENAVLMFGSARFLVQENKLIDLIRKHRMVKLAYFEK